MTGAGRNREDVGKIWGRYSLNLEKASRDFEKESSRDLAPESGPPEAAKPCTGPGLALHVGG